MKSERYNKTQHNAPDSQKKGQGVSTRGEATPDETISARRKQGVQN